MDLNEFLDGIRKDCYQYMLRKTPPFELVDVWNQWSRNSLQSISNGKTWQNHIANSAELTTPQLIVDVFADNFSSMYQASLLFIAANIIKN